MTGVLLGPLTAGVDGGPQQSRLPVSFMAPEPALATAPDANAPVRELKQVIQGLHDAGLEAILQVSPASLIRGM